MARWWRTGGRALAYYLPAMTVTPLTLRRGAQYAAAVALVVALVAISPLGAAMLAPALALAVAVGLGWFTGERPVAWVRRVMRRRRGQRRLPAPARAPRRPDWVAPAGVRVAFDLAMRPPPAPLR